MCGKADDGLLSISVSFTQSNTIFNIGLSQLCNLSLIHHKEYLHIFIYTLIYRTMVGTLWIGVLLSILLIDSCLSLSPGSRNANNSKYQVTKPARFYVAPSKLVDIATSGLQFLLRGGTGAFVDGYKVAWTKDETSSDEYSILRAFGYMIKETSSKWVNRPKKPIVLYEFEACPYCKRVREAVVSLDLDVLFLPTPKGSPNYRVEAIEIGGKAQFPYMIDPNSNVKMYESSDIIEYLYKTYGSTSSSSGENEVSDIVIPGRLKNTFFNTLALSIATLARFGKGSKYEKAKFIPKDKAIVYYGYEASPFCKLVRERLVELELPHIQKSCGRSSTKRNELQAKALALGVDTFQVPYIYDPNTGVELFESADIVEYLNEVYAV